MFAQCQTDSHRQQGSGSTPPPAVTHPVTLCTRKMPRRHSQWRRRCSCRAEVTEVTLSLTQTLRTWTQTQTHTVRTDAHLKGSFPFQTNGQCVMFVNWVVSCWSRRRMIRLSVDKLNSSSARYSRQGLLICFLPHFMSPCWVRRSMKCYISR